MGLGCREAAAYGPSSCLRTLLDPRDAALGPLMPGRDSLEDELRGFRGGAEGLPPVMWNPTSPFFPQPVALPTAAVDAMLLQLAAMFVALSGGGSWRFWTW